MDQDTSKPQGPVGIGISTLVDHRMEFSQLVPLIAQAGFSHLSLGHLPQYTGYHLERELPQIRELLAEHKLQLDHIHAPLLPCLDLASPVEHLRNASVSFVKLSFDACAYCAGRAVVVHGSGGGEFPAAEHNSHVQAGLRSLDELAEYAGSSGVSLALENLNTGTPDERVTMELMEATASWGTVGICLDTCHAWLGLCEAYDPDYFIKRLAPRVVATHFSDTPGGSDTHLIPGEGIVDFALVARRLSEAGYNGVLGLECSLSMLRQRLEDAPAHHGVLPTSTGNYLYRAYAAAEEIAAQLGSGAEH